MGNLLIAIILFVIYYFLEQFFLKRSLLNSGKKISKIINESADFSKVDTNFLRKNTEYYILHHECLSFTLLNNKDYEIQLIDLDYYKLVRFKQLIKAFNNNTLGDYEFFVHNKYKHLLFPFKSKNDTIEILLLQTRNNTINDIFDRNPKKII